MSSPSSNPNDAERVDLERQVAAKEARKLRAQADKHQSIWFGLGMMGIVGWSIAIPALAGVLAGVWIDAHWPSKYSWALMLLVIGICVGCLNAWNWIERERRQAPRSNSPSDNLESKGGDNGK
ncbi:MAG: AtpZ/AtpI family protein [Planctomycetaceae bacterium]|nr:AtpZ/AtpI family protein [Planctomycetaceae bacterium]